MSTISAVIITYNEEANIRDCIESIQPISDEIIVIDSGSTDATAAICREKGVTFKERKFTSFSDQKNYGNSLTRFDYILSIDADERLSPTLLKSLQSIKTNMTFGGYTANRSSYYGGRPIKTCGWYPDNKLRVWKRDNGIWKGHGLHEKIELIHHKSVKHLHGDILHYSYKDVASFLDKIQRYSVIYARDKRFRLHSSGYNIFYKTLFAFIKSYLLRRGIFDGYEGLLISVANACHTFFKYAKLKEENSRLGVSLVISTYNKEIALEKVLASAMNLSEKPDEIIIADDGSGAATKASVEKYMKKSPIPIRHCWQDDVGFRLSTIRNKAVAASAFEYIVMIDGDIIMPPHFIRDHKRNAQKKQIVQGSRVLLGPALTEKWLGSAKHRLSIFSGGIKNRFNGLYSPWISKIASSQSTNVERIRGANISFWKSDFLHVNGFNEAFVGWGREDSEFIVRMQHIGVVCKRLKFMGFGYHLYHEELPRENLTKNDQILKNAIRQKLSWCTKGVNQYT